MQKLTLENPRFCEITGLVWPPMLDYFLSTLVSLVDLFFVSRLGPGPVAALGVGWPIVFVVNSLAMSLGVGTAAVVAHHVGAGEMAEARAAAGSSSLVFSLVGLGLSLVMAVFGYPIYRLFAMEPAVSALGASYLAALAPFMGFRCFYYVVTYSLRSAGDMRTPLYMSALSLVVGMVADFFLIPRIGIAGAGLSYGLVSVVLGVYSLVSLFHVMGVRPRDMFGGMGQLRRILAISMPAVAEQVTLRVGFLGFARLVTGFGTAATAAHTLAVRIESLSFMPAVGLGTVAGTIAGQCLGAGLPDSATKGVGKVMKIGVAFMSVMGVLLALLAVPLASGFSPDPGSRDLSALLIMISAAEQPAFGFFMPYLWAIRVTGWIKGALLLSAVGSIVIRIPLCYLFGYVFRLGVAGVWIGGVLDWYIRGVMGYLLFRWGKWRKVWKPVPETPVTPQ